MKTLVNCYESLLRVSLVAAILLIRSLFLSASVLSDSSGKAETAAAQTAEQIKFVAFQGLDENELQSGVWQLCGRPEISSLSGTAYYDGRLYSENIGRRSDYYVNTDDSLAWTGYSEGRSLGMLIDTPFALRPLKIGLDATNSKAENIKQYLASGALDVGTKLSENGTSSFAGVRRGNVIITPGDTLSDVILTRHTDNYIIQSDLTAEADTASRVVYRWFAKGSAIPLAIQYEDILYASVSDCGELESEDKNSPEEVDRIRTVIDKATIIREGNTLTVALPEELSLHIYIMDIPGNLYGSASGVADRYMLDITDLLHNSYIVSIVSDECGYTRRILLTV